MNNINRYYNYRTGAWNYMQGPPADWSDYIPQNESAQALYSLYVEVYNYTPIEAAGKVLMRCVPPPDSPNDK